MPSRACSTPPARRSSSSSTASRVAAASSTGSSCSAPDGVIADGTPEAVLGARGAELAAGGCGCPASRRGCRPAAVGEPGETLLAASGLVVGRHAQPVAVRSMSRCAPARCSRSPGPTAPASRRSASRSPACCRRSRGNGDRSRPRRDPHPLAVARAADPHRHGVPGPGAPVRSPHRARRARGRAARPLGLAPTEIAPRVDELLERLRLDPPRRGEPVHALGRRAAAADRRDDARDRPARPRARRADLRPGLRHLGRARRAHRGAAWTAASSVVASTHDLAFVDALAGPRALEARDPRHGAAHEPGREARRRGADRAAAWCSRSTGSRRPSRCCSSCC